MKEPRLPIEKKPISREAKKNLYLIVLNSLLLIFIYFGSMGLNVTIIKPYVITPYPITLGQLVYILYWAAFAAFLLGYIIYNRAFTRKGVTAEMLPDTWSFAKKQEYIEDAKKRLEKSKWMLSVIVPLLVTIALDALYLFTLPLIENLLF